MQFLNFIIISIYLFWTLGLALPAHESKVVKRNFGPDHKGYQCGTKKYIMFDIDVAVKNACRAYSYQRKPKIFWSIFRDDSYPRLFPEAKSLKIPSKAQMWPLPPTGLNVISYNYVIFTPADCKFVKVVHKSHKKKHEKHEKYEICKYVVWPSSWTDIFKPSKR